MSTSKYLIRFDDVEPYHPANHTETSNRRLVSRHNVGAQHMEVIHGTLGKSGGALPHAHPGVEQVCYLLEGSAHVEVGDEAFEMQAGDTCFFPAGRHAQARGDLRDTGQTAGGLQPTVRREPCQSQALTRRSAIESRQ